MTGKRYDIDYRTTLRVRALLLYSKGDLDYIGVHKVMIDEGWLSSDDKPMSYSSFRNQMIMGRRDKKVRREMKKLGVDPASLRKRKYKKFKRKNAVSPTPIIGVGRPKKESLKPTGKRAAFLVEAVLIDEHLTDSQRVKMLKDYFNIK